MLYEDVPYEGEKDYYGDEPYKAVPYEGEDDYYGYESYDDEVYSNDPYVTSDELKKSLNAYSKTAKSFDLLDIAPAIPFVLGNIIKYTLRAPHKGQKASDMAKAKDYYFTMVDNYEVYTACQIWYNEHLDAMRLIRKLYGDELFADVDSADCTLNNFCDHVLAL